MIGQKISHFEVIEELGRGGMGVVYKGHDTRLNRPVALKFLSRALSDDPAATKRFFKEAQAAAALEHVNVCSIFEISESPSEGPYIVMGFCDGQSLHELLADRQLELREIASLAHQIGSGLAHAHRNGVVHRDLKPGNVIVTRDGIAKIVDFGIASVHESTIADEHGTQVGTPAYMSPEQLRGEPSDHRSDIWSFGILLHEMFTGNNPFRGGYDQATIYNVLNVQPTTVADARPDAPISWSSTILKCLEKDPSARFESLEEVLDGISSGNEAPGLAASTLAFHGYLPNIGTRVYVGRKEEGRNLLERLSQEQGTVTLVSGESGIGKTRLVSRILEEKVAEGSRVLWGRCLFDEGTLPYHPFVSSLKKGFPQSRDVAADIKAYADRNELELRGHSSQLRAFLLAGGGSEQVLNKEQIWHAVLLVYKLLASKEHPLILVVDDLQWADSPTVALFCYLARSIEQSNIHLIGLYRLDALSGRGGTSQELLVESIRQLRIDGLAAQIDLTRFGREDSDALLEQMLDGDDVSDDLKTHIFEQSQGLPLFLAESLNLLRLENRIHRVDGVWQLPSNGATKPAVSVRVQDVIMQRLDVLDEEDRELLEVAAVEGEVFTSEPLEACIGWPRIRVLKRLQAIEKKFQLIMHEPGGYRFDHNMIRQVLYDGVLPELRQEYHRLIASALASRHAGNDDHAAPIALHLIASGQESAAAPFLLRAADRARSVHASEQALRRYKELDRIRRKVMPEDVELGMAVEQGLGTVNYVLGDVQTASQHFGNWLELARSNGDIRAELEARCRLADSLRITGRSDEALDLIDKALALAQDAGFPTETMRVLQTYAEVAAARGSYQLSAEYASQALATASERNDRANSSIAASILGFAYWHMGSFRRAQEYFSDALKTQRAIGDRLGMATTLNFLALSLWKLGHFEDAIRSAEESVAIKRAISQVRAIPGSLNIIGDVYRDLFAPEKAIEFHTASLELATSHDNKGAMCDNLRDLGADHLAKGDFETAESFMRQALSHAKSAGIKWYETRSCIGIAETLFKSGSLTEAREYADWALALATEIQAKELLIEAKRTLALVLDDPQHRRTLLEEVLQASDDLALITLSWQIRAELADLVASMGFTERGDQLRMEARGLIHEIVDGMSNESMKSGFLQAVSVAGITAD